MDGPGVVGVRTRRAGRAARRVVRAEHEVVDEELRAPVEELGQRLRPLVRLERVLLLDRHPGQLSTLPRELVAEARELFLPLEQLDPGRPPLLAGSEPVHDFISISIDGDIPGSVNPGTRRGGDRDPDPEGEQRNRNGRERRTPCGKDFLGKDHGRDYHHPDEAHHPERK